MKPNVQTPPREAAWNKGKLVGQKTPLKLKEIWAIRIRLQLTEKVRDLALFNLAIDSKLRGCDLLSLKVSDVAQGRSIMHRAIVMQRKTHRPVQFEVTDITRQALLAWIDHAKLSNNAFLFPSRIAESPHLSTRQYGASSGNGLPRLDSILWPMVHIRCAVRKRR
jgi:integrase